MSKESEKLFNEVKESFEVFIKACQKFSLQMQKESGAPINGFRRGGFVSPEWKKDSDREWMFDDETLIKEFKRHQVLTAKFGDDYGVTMSDEMRERIRQSQAEKQKQSYRNAEERIVSKQLGGPVVWRDGAWILRE